MSNEDNKPKNSQEEDDAAAKEAAKKAQMDELFGDLDDEEEDFDAVVEERNRLRTQFTAAASGLEEAQKTNAKLQDMLNAQKSEHDKLLDRVKAEADTQKDFALEKFVKELLPVVDTFERGIKFISAEDRANNAKLDKMAQGFEKSLVQLAGVFNKYGISSINPVGEEFDPSKHEAVSTADHPDMDSDHVVSVAEKGYELKGRVIRTAKVIVKP